MQDECFAFVNNRCLALKVRQCKGCSFYKTKEQHRLDQMKALERILSLDADRRSDIIRTYYGGKLEVS